LDLFARLFPVISSMVAARIVALLPALIVAADVKQAQDVKVDWEKLTDFSTDVSASVQNQWGPDRVEVKGLNLTGHIQFDLANERLKVTVRSTFDLAQGPIDVQGQGVSELYFDPKHGAHIKESATLHSALGSQEVAYCIKTDVPAGKVPPGGMLQAMLEAKEPMVEQSLNAAPHTCVGTPCMDGDLVYSTLAPGVTLTIEPDGTPVSVIASEGGQINFKNWKKGAGEMEEPHCVEQSPANVMPSISLIMMDAVSDQLVQSVPMHPLGKHLARLTVLLQEKRLQVPSEPAWHSAVLPFVAGMSGAAVVLAFVKVMAGKRVHSEPLLSAA